MNIQQLTTFLRIAELQNFTKAAKQLGYSQSAVTVQIKQLEKELGMQLFERIGKQVSLTAQGRKFVGYAAQVLQALQAVESFAHGKQAPKGIMRLGSAESLLTRQLAPLLLQFAKKYAEVETVVRSGSNEMLYDMINKNLVDIIYCLDAKITNPEWVKALEYEEPIVFVTSAQNKLVHKRHISLEALVQEPCILTEKGISYRAPLDKMLADKGLTLHPLLEIGNTDVICTMLLRSSCISFLPLFAVQEYIKKKQLAVLKVPEVEITMWSQLFYHKHKWVTPQMELFIKLLQHSRKL